MTKKAIINHHDMRMTGISLRVQCPHCDTSHFHDIYITVKMTDNHKCYKCGNIYRVINPFAESAEAIINEAVE